MGHMFITCSTTARNFLSICSRQNQYYFKKHMKPSEINHFLTNEIESIIYANERRRCSISFLSIPFFASDVLYWCTVPDIIKYIFLKVVIDFIRKPLYRALKFLLLCTCKFERVNTEILLFNWHCKQRL